LSVSRFCTSSLICAVRASTLQPFANHAVVRPRFMRRRAAPRRLSARLVNAPVRGWHPALSSHDLRILRLCISPFASPFVEIYYRRSRGPPLIRGVLPSSPFSLTGRLHPLGAASRTLYPPPSLFYPSAAPPPCHAFPFPAFLRLPPNHRSVRAARRGLQRVKGWRRVGTGGSGIQGRAGKRSQGLDGR